MKTITQDERHLVVEALLDVAALMEAIAHMADFAAETTLEDSDRVLWSRREDTIAHLPSLVRIMREKLNPVDHLIINYDFNIVDAASTDVH
ncbi:hypothetical protein ASD54_10950 [Rhizobium sp. Root149]|uniref:hypothetical protein n=1 Tax=Rhizobium sp. Root149 TaxID=1736473 RepID=UPI0007123D97|nr:hypothetical protein [Rhizobium sp. Root149]KQZ50719.1 hypothetical protein ASD54_10950 [Rhizobium sp. Root149]